MFVVNALGTFNHVFLSWFNDFMQHIMSAAAISFWLNLAGFCELGQIHSF